MIPVDIDNFVIYSMVDYYYKKHITISRYTCFIPREISNCVKLHHISLTNRAITNLSVLANCVKLKCLYIDVKSKIDISIFSKCTSLEIIFIEYGEIASCIRICSK